MQVDLGQFRIAHFYTRRIDVCVQLAADTQSGTGVCRRDQVHHHFVTYQGASAPVLRDAGKQPMLHLVPFTGTRGKVTDADGQAGLIGQALQFIEAGVNGKS